MSGERSRSSRFPLFLTRSCDDASSSPLPLTAHGLDRGVRREVLPNGLTLLVQPDRSAPVVAVVTHVKAGFFDEPDRWTGISHVLEHMFFKGTARRGVGAIARETKSAGGYLNASTDVRPHQLLHRPSRLQSRRGARHPGRRAAPLRHRRGRAGPRAPGHHPGSQAQARLAVVGGVRDAARGDVRPPPDPALAHRPRGAARGVHPRRRLALLRSRYVPERTIVAIVGAVDPDRALALARAAYGDWPAAPGAVDPSPEEPDRREVRARTLRGDVSQAELVLGWRDGPAAACRRAGARPGRGGARARAAAAGSTGRCGSRGSSPGSPRTTTRRPSWACSASAPSWRPSGCRGARRHRRVRGPADACWGRRATSSSARARCCAARWARRLESMEGEASALAAAEALDDVSFLDREYEAIQAVDADDVRAAAARYLQPDACPAWSTCRRDRAPS